MLKAVIFDMDGVLIDSEPIYMMYLMDCIEKQLKEKVSDELRHKLYRVIGLPDQDIYKMVWESLQETDIKKTGVIEGIKSMYESPDNDFHLDYRTILNPHVLNILPELKKIGLKMAIASSSPFENIEEVIMQCGIEKYFNVIASGLDFKNSKPDPEIYLSTIKKLRVNKDEVIVIEDSTYGIEACNNAGIPVIAKADLRFDFKQSTADYIADDLLEAYYIIKEKVYK